MEGVQEEQCQMLVFSEVKEKRERFPQDVGGKCFKLCNQLSFSPMGREGMKRLGWKPGDGEW